MLRRDRLESLLSGSFLRFFTASLFGLVLDVSLALALTHLGHFGLIPSAAVALLTVSAVMYLVHEFWTFRTGARHFSAKRMFGVIGSALAALVVRSACLYTTSEPLGLGERFALAQFVAATGLSFALNYLVVRRIVAGSTAERSEAMTPSPSMNSHA